MQNWLHTASALVTTLSGALLTFDWTQIVSAQHVGMVLMILGALKAVAGTISPSVPASATTDATK